MLQAQPHVLHAESGPAKGSMNCSGPPPAQTAPLETNPGSRTNSDGLPKVSPRVCAPPEGRPGKGTWKMLCDVCLGACSEG